MTQRRKHYDVIVAWAEGKPVQFRKAGQWRNIAQPAFADSLEYRVKPEVVRYRLALFSEMDGFAADVAAARDAKDVAEFEGHARFSHWLADWQEVEV